MATDDRVLSGPSDLNGPSDPSDLNSPSSSRSSSNLSNSNNSSGSSDPREAHQATDIFASREEEMLGMPLKSARGDVVRSGGESLLGRARVVEKSLAGSGERGLAGNETPEERFEVLLSMTHEYLAEGEEALLAHAYRFASRAHEGQCRKSGEPFIAHPVEVAIILADLRMDIETLCAALLHDTVEDTDATSAQLSEEFNGQIAQLVDGVTKISRIEVENLTDEQAQTIRKMLVAMSKDIRVIIIKLADRLHNMRTLMALPEDRRIFKSRETLEVYAPIAHRLGIESIKWELEDLAFFYLEPNKYKQVSRMVTESRNEREEYLKQVIGLLEEELAGLGTQAQIMGRPKHLFSIYQKMSHQGKGFSEIYDLIAVRIIVENIRDCYSVLGAVHTLWHPIPGRFKDYIATPKNNMYQSLHTTVLGPAARPLEVQIRTQEMHDRSEYGVAAHWRYKETGGSERAKRESEFDRQLAWLRQTIDWQDETRDSHEFLSSLKLDLAESEVYVFTPKGEVISLRNGATPVDFAYAIHTEVGHHCVGAKVDGAIVPLTYKLKLGERVEILTQKSASPSRDWLTFVATPGARSKIRAYFSKMSRSDDLQFGREKLMREMRKHGIGISSAQSMRAIKTVSEHLGYKDADDMLVQIGANKESAQHVANRLLKIIVDRGTHDAQEPGIGAGESSTGVLPPMLTSVKRPKRHEAHSSNGIIVRGIDDVLVRLSRCCNPVPGDDIIGFVTRGRGVSIHRRDCPNALELEREPERIIEVAWDTDSANKATYSVEVLIEALDRMGLLKDVATVLSEMAVNVASVTTTTQKDGVVEMRFVFQMSNVSYISTVLTKLRGIEGVFDARRMVPQGQASKKKKKGN